MSQHCFRAGMARYKYPVKRLRPELNLKSSEQLEAASDSQFFHALEYNQRTQMIDTETQQIEVSFSLFVSSGPFDLVRNRIIEQL